MSESRSGLFNFSSVPDAYREHLQPSVFDPWAHALLAFVPPESGSVILDVAAGTGAVAHAAAVIAGPRGRVIAADVSSMMLADAGLAPSDYRAPVELLECPADKLALPDASFDVVYCQQGLQFMPDRAAVMTEVLRVLRPGGSAGIAVWSDRKPPEPFDMYARVLQEHGIAEPYPGAYDLTKVTMSEAEIEALLTAAGFPRPTVRTVDLLLDWPDAEVAALGILGSTYGQTVASLNAEEQAEVFASIVEEASDGRPRLMSAVVGRGVAI
ncbi:MAG TPA: methyltransferase domain-containing protein [Acidimicrobiales bacterium]|jgi:ubiquinone/menaquinone biosynthesis C-methylase UbiE|nr:methyltransferase domain-containing protein [Acidimicrobiales bacterium]